MGPACDNKCNSASLPVTFVDSLRVVKLPGVPLIMKSCHLSPLPRMTAAAWYTPLRQKVHPSLHQARERPVTYEA